MKKLCLVLFVLGFISTNAWARQLFTTTGSDGETHVVTDGGAKEQLEATQRQEEEKAEQRREHIYQSTLDWSNRRKGKAYNDE